VGAIRDVPIVTKGTVTAGRRMKVTMSCDHRALDGLMGAQFLKEFKRVLEHPQELVAHAGGEPVSFIRIDPRTITR
jgi:pyruvate dehydrogenase E2 component (dihydrolipoamide acetyltransferase)